MTILKKVVLLSVASSGLLTLATAMPDAASAEPYISGSATVTNVDGSTYSVAGEVGGVQANNATITPAYSTTDATARDKISNLVVNTTASAGAPAAQSAVENQVVNTLTTLANSGNFTGNNLGNYLSILRSSVGADGLD
ncbi:MAG: hypothetical protein NW224_16070 [Leptolyngbyaceae cyanobacterium bins.302]|nr:hypothetical protein [Leptolyngbyaceae cyanobacterium bins.302]